MDIRYDCRHFKGTMPCIPHKEHGVECSSECEYLDPTDGNILIIKLGAMGDVIRTTPILHQFKKEYPHKRIFWLTHFPAVLPEVVDRNLAFTQEDISYIHSLKFDMAINLDKEHEACALMEQLDIKSKYGFGLKNDMPAPINEMAEHKFLTGISDSYSKENTQHYLEEIFSLCGWEYNNEKYILPQMKSNSAIENFKSEKPIVGLNTGCGERWTSRQWPIEHWKELASLMLKNGQNVLLLGGDQEHEMNTNIKDKTGAEYLGVFPFNEFQSLVAECSVVVSTVTMAMHVAIGLEKPLVLLNNIFNPHEFHFFTKSKILDAEKDCECFYRPTCVNELSCIAEITPVAVMNSIISLTQA